MAVLLGLVVVTLLGFAAPAFAGGQSDERGKDHGCDDCRPDLVGEVRGNPDRPIPDEKGDGHGSDPAEEAGAPRGAPIAPAAPAARTAAPATAPAVIEVAEAPSALAALAAAPPAADLPVVAASAAVPAAAPAPLPTPVPDELLASAPPLAPPAAAVAPSVGAVSAPADAVPPAPIDEAPPPAPPAGDAGGEEQRAAATGTDAERSFTALLVLIAAALLFLAVQGRIDRRDARRGDRPPGDFRRFR